MLDQRKQGKQSFGERNSSPVHPWSGVPYQKWRDWRWQLRNAVTSAEQLAELAPLTQQEIHALGRVTSVYPMRITPYYLSLVRWDDPQDPIRLQVIPDAAELIVDPHLAEDPLEEEAHSPLPGVVHRYPDRVLLITPNFCPVICRHCTRKRLMRGDVFEPDWEKLHAAVDYIRQHPGVRDVLVSGGNPLCLPLSRLDRLLGALSEIPHVDVIRIGAREPVTLPQRLFDRELLRLLRRLRKKLWIVTHFNHPRELTDGAAEAVGNLVELSIPVSNQTVLLRGVNDDPEILRGLFRGLLRTKVRPYYLLHADPTQGTSHFRTTVCRGMQLIESLRGTLSGLAIPAYVVDSPQLGKLPVVPQYVEEAKNSYLRLRDLRGQKTIYPDGRE